jgi:hypothetical protein
MTSTHPFRRWRKSRPFWGALLVIVGGAEILLTVWAPLGVVLHVGMQGLAGYLVPVMLLLAGILLLVSPGQRLFYSILAALLAMASWVTSNLGGFIFGLILCLVGAALAFAWTPAKGRPPAKDRPLAKDRPEPPRVKQEQPPAPVTGVDGLLDSDSVVPGRHARTEDAPG